MTVGSLPPSTCGPSAEMLQMIMPPERGDKSQHAIDGGRSDEIWVRLSLTVRSK